MPVQSDLAYPVLFYPDPSPPGRKSLVTDLQHMPCLHTVCMFDYPVPSPIRMFLCKTDVCGYHAGTSEGILVWYGQPCEVQFTRGGGMAERTILEIWSPNQCILLINRVLGANSGTVRTVVTVP